MNQNNTFLGEANLFEQDFARYRNASLDSVHDVVARQLNTRNRLLVRFRPEKSGREAQVAVDRSKMPALGGDKPFNAPEVKTAKLENGMEVFVVERTDLPKVAVTLATKAGGVQDPVGKEGLADLTQQTVKRGTKTRQALEIEDGLGDLGTSISGSTGYEYANEHGSAKRNLSPALTIFSDVVRNPSFPAAEIDREKKQRLDALSQQSRTPTPSRRRVGQMVAFGADHPTEGLLVDCPQLFKA